MIMFLKTPLAKLFSKSIRNSIIAPRSLKRTATSSIVKQVQIVSDSTKIRNSCRPWLSKPGLIWLATDRNRHQLIQLCFHQWQPLIIPARLQSSKRCRQPTWMWREEGRARKPTEFSLPYHRHRYPSRVRTSSCSPWETCQQPLSTTATSQRAVSETCRPNSSRDRASACPRPPAKLTSTHQWTRPARRCNQD